MQSQFSRLRLHFKNSVRVAVNIVREPVCRHGSINVSVTQVDHANQSKAVVTHPFPRASLADPGGIRILGYLLRDMLAVSTTSSTGMPSFITHLGLCEHPACRLIHSMQKLVSTWQAYPSGTMLSRRLSFQCFCCSIMCSGKRAGWHMCRTSYSKGVIQLGGIYSKPTSFYTKDTLR